MTMPKIVQDRLEEERRFPCHVVIKNVLAYGDRLSEIKWDRLSKIKWDRLSEIKWDLDDAANHHEGVLFGYHYRNEVTGKFHLKFGFKNEFHMLDFLEEIEDDFPEIQVGQGDEEYGKHLLYRKARRWSKKTASSSEGV